MALGIFARASPEGLCRGHRVLPEAAGDGRLPQEPSSLFDSLGRRLVGSPVYVPGGHLCVGQSAGKHGQQGAGVGPGLDIWESLFKKKKEKNRELGTKVSTVFILT